MDGVWKCSFFVLLQLLAVCVLFHCKITFCFSLNNQGLVLLRFKERVVSDPYNALASWKFLDGNLYPCSWSGVHCSSDGEVIGLKLRDLCLQGTLAPELGQLTHLKSLILRNNSFSGIIPEQIGELRGLEILDLGYNNFSGSFPPDIDNKLSDSIILLDNNKYISNMPPEIYDLKMLYEPQDRGSNAILASSNRLSKSWNVLHKCNTALRRFLKGISSVNPTESERNRSPPSPSLTPAPSPASPAEPPVSSISSPPSSLTSFSVESPSPSPSDSSPPLPTPAPSFKEKPPIVLRPEESPLLTPIPAAAPSLGSHRNKNLGFILLGVIGGSTLLIFSVLSILYCQKNKVVTVRPWTTGLSGQLQKAFTTGVPKLQRSELEIACEDFSNIIGSLSDGTVYKGTLSSGVEIAVTSAAAKSAKNWSKNFETQFRNKIDTLSIVNHKNFVNLIGYCEEEMPFTRMMVFEYAPNGTLFEHLHIKESEHLDWSMRLRIAMGIAYCLEYMHNLTPPIAHWNLQSSSIYLTEDYAAKISDFSIWNEVIAAKMGSETMELLETPSTDTESNLYNFGLILLEMITGRLPFSVHDGSLAEWALDYVGKGRPLRDIVDPTLHSFREEEIEKLFELAKHCLRSNPEERPRMGEIAARMKEITTLGPEGATPKSSPLWWAELEILSTA